MLRQNSDTSDSVRDEAASVSEPVRLPSESYAKNPEIADTDCDHALTCVSFIIPARNEEIYIGRCIDAIKQLVLPKRVGEIEIIVVDNESTDCTVRISQARGAIVITVPPGKPSRARNAGAQAANGSLLAFIDADCELAPNWLAVCHEHLARNAEVVAAAGAIRAPGDEASWVERAWYGLAHASNRDQASHVRWLPSFNLLVRRSAFQQVGGFDEMLTTCEDCALGYRLDEIGTLVLDPSTRAAHFGESKTLGDVVRREAWRSGGNLRLALHRPRDWKNWISLLMPLAIVILACTATLGFIVALIIRASLWPWLAGLALVLAIIVILVRRKGRACSWLDFGQRVCVYSAYLAGRTLGMVRTFRRLQR